MRDTPTADLRDKSKHSWITSSLHRAEPVNDLRELRRDFPEPTATESGSPFHLNHRHAFVPESVVEARPGDGYCLISRNDMVGFILIVLFKNAFCEDGMSCCLFGSKLIHLDFRFKVPGKVPVYAKERQLCSGLIQRCHQLEVRYILDLWEASQPILDIVGITVVADLYQPRRISVRIHAKYPIRRHSIHPATLLPDAAELDVASHV